MPDNKHLDIEVWSMRYMRSGLWHEHSQENCALPGCVIYCVSCMQGIAAFLQADAARQQRMQLGLVESTSVVQDESTSQRCGAYRSRAY